MSRRAVTGHQTDGKSIIASDTEVKGIAMPGSPGTNVNVLWGTDKTLTYPDEGTEPRHQDLFPPSRRLSFRRICSCSRQYAACGR